MKYFSILVFVAFTFSCKSDGEKLCEFDGYEIISFKDNCEFKDCEYIIGLKKGMDFKELKVSELVYNYYKNNDSLRKIICKEEVMLKGQE